MVTPLPEPMSSATGTDAGIFDRLRAADATIEELQHLIRSQEVMAHELSVATGELARATSELAHVQGGRRKGAGLRRAARRVKRLVGRTTSSIDVVEPIPLETGTTFADSRYPQWIELYDTLDEHTREKILHRIGDLADAPLVSVIVPVFNTPEIYLREAIESVRSQLYERWELCISDDCSTDPRVEKVLREYAAIDSRIRIVWRESNGHISASSNSALELASGSWVCLMDHDDVLADHALALAVLAITERPGAALLYSDEDHLNAGAVRSAPYFKPDYDPLLLLGQNYFSHMTMLRRDLVDSVGGFRVGYEGSQDWDLVLRAVEQIDPEQIVHVPHVLYHWRAHAESTASTLGAKPYVIEASRRVVQEHLDRTGVEARISTVWGSSFNRINWRLPDAPPPVSIVVLPRDGLKLTRCIDSIRAISTYPNVEIIVVDDGAFRPPMRQYLRDHAAFLTIVESKDDISDSAQRNLAATFAKGEVLIFVHDDVEVLGSGWIEEVVGTLSFPGIGAAGVKLMYPDMRVQHAGITIGIGGTVGHSHRWFFSRFDGGYSGRLMLAQCPSAVSWACLAVRRDAFDAVGGFSEEHFTGMFGDVDLCLRLREAGWRTAWTPHAEMLHYERVEDARGTDGENAVRFDRDIRYLQQRWGTWVKNDPAYNPNLSVAHETFLLAWPPRQPLV